MRRFFYNDASDATYGSQDNGNTKAGKKSPPNAPELHFWLSGHPVWGPNHQTGESIIKELKSLIIWF